MWRNGRRGTPSEIEESPPPISTAVASVPPDLDRLVARCLEKNPGARLQSARELAIALRDTARASDTDAACSRPRFRARPAVIAALSLLITASAGALYYRTSFRGTNSIAILPFVNASGNPDMEYLGDGITETLINSLSQAPNLTVMSRNAVFRYKGRETDAQQVGARLDVEAVLAGRVAQRGDTLSISVELIDVRSNRQLWGGRFNRRAAGLRITAEQRYVPSYSVAAIYAALGRKDDAFACIGPPRSGVAPVLRSRGLPHRSARPPEPSSSAPCRAPGEICGSRSRSSLPNPFQGRTGRRRCRRARVPASSRATGG
jgi:TolB-like protein